jgi:N-acetylglucosamine-6-phosphate deacetylase
MKTAIIYAKIISNDTIIENGKISIDNGIINGINQVLNENNFDIIVDAKNNFLSPGFIDLHIHGGGGYDFMDGSVKAFTKIAETHIKYGTTTLMPTALTDLTEQIIDVIETFGNIIKNNTTNVSFLVIHLEGPYFAMEQRGAQNPIYIRNTDIHEINSILKYEKLIKRWSIAHELLGDLQLGNMLNEKNIIASVAHPNALYDYIVAAVSNGYNLITHLYSAMKGVTRKNAYRYAGTIEAAYLIDDLFLEIIADGKHVPIPLLKIVYKIKGPDKIALITDAMRASGTSYTKSILGSKLDGIEVLIEDEVAKLPDKTSFAGSIATTSRLVKTMWKDAELPLSDVIKMMCTSSPAKIAGIDHKLGTIEINKIADLVIFDDNVNVYKVIKNGVIVQEVD